MNRLTALRRFAGQVALLLALALLAALITGATSQAGVTARRR